MKIRSGFVSNSSSSNFIVAFPCVPKTWKDVFLFMFNNEDGEEKLYDYLPALNRKDIAKRVFKDVKKYLNGKKISVKEIAKEFLPRYYFVVGGYINDEPERKAKGGSWAHKELKYWGNDPETLEEIRKLQIKTRKSQDAIYKKIWAYEHKHFPEDVPFASDEHWFKNKYTAEQVAAYEEWEKKDQEAKNNDKVYQALLKEFGPVWDEERKIYKLSQKVATIDAKDFLKKNKGKFIVCLSYSDNKKGETVLEHGNIFRNVEKVQISHH